MKIMKFEISKVAMINATVAFGLVAVAVAFPDLAFAQANLQEPTENTASGGVMRLVNDVTGNLTGVLPAFSAAAYIGGTIFAISTLLDAKKYSEDPGQFKGGVPKIVTKGAVAAGLFALPALTNTIGSSFFGRDTQTTYTPLNANLGSKTQILGQ